MPSLNLKPTHKPIKQYYEELEQFQKLGVVHETAVKTAFQKLLESCGSPAILILKKIKFS